MGGSMTFGQSTTGCCCEVELDSKCPSNTTCHEQLSFEDGDTHASYCSWGRYFGRWLENEFALHLISPPKTKKKINLINLAVRGHGSRVAAEYLLIRYPPGSSKSFKSTDLVFLDFSVNDCSGGFGPRLGSEIESLIRRFLHYGSDMPTLILLETYPFQMAGQSFSWNTPGFGGSQDYTTYYRQVARYYQLPLWSYATSFFDKVSMAQPYHPYLRSMASHPAWFVHLYVADTYASVMKHEVHRYCVKEIQQTREKFFPLNPHLPQQQPQEQQQGEEVSFNLPPMLYSGDEKECLQGGDHHRQFHTNAKTEFQRLSSTGSPASAAPPPLDQDELEWEIINLKTMEIISSSSLPLPSSSPSSQGMWRLYEDRPSKAGWIVIPESNPPHSLLRFSLSKVDFSSKRIPTLTIGQLRTYEHAGRVAVLVCGRAVGDLTALWPDYQHHRVSVTHLTHLDLSLEVMEICSELPREKRRLEFRPQFVNKEEKFKLLSITFCDLQ